MCTYCVYGSTRKKSKNSITKFYRVTKFYSDPADDPIEFRDAVFRFFAGGAVDTIGTQIAGKESDTNPGLQVLEIRSVETDPSTGVCGSRVSGPQTIEMAYKCNNPTTCETTAVATRVQVTNTSPASFDISPGNDNADTVDDANGSFSNVDLTFNASGQAGFSFDFNDVGQIQLYARLTIPASGDDPEYTLFGASNMFVVRPFGFDIDNAGQRASDWLQSPAGLNGTKNDLTDNTSWAQDATGTAFAKAGNNFNVTVRSVVWQSGDDGDNDGVPDAAVNLTDNALTPNFGNESTTE